jgi:hypothetical protein
MRLNSTELGRRIEALNLGTIFFYKDIQKAHRATQFIGDGHQGSSTARYAAAAGALANTGHYTAEDRVFVSVNGNRPDRVPLLDAQGALFGVYAHVATAMAAGATLLADSVQDRERRYNVGERELARYLLSHGYVEVAPGEWRPHSS